MVDFIGRQHELDTLTTALAGARAEMGTARPGRCLVLRGRRRIGKSALVEEFVDRNRVPNVYYTSEIGFGSDPLASFVDEVRSSSLPDADVFAEALPGNWTAALRQLAGILPTDQPSVVVPTKCRT